jgi:hypothetical protein
MAVSNQQIFDFLLANPNISDAELAAVMQEFNVTPQQIAEATGTSATEAVKRFEAVVPPAPVERVIPTARGTVIEGDNIEAQMAGVPQVVYETRVDPNNPANWETYNPKTGEVINRGTFAGGGDRGLLAAAAPVIGLAASTVGLPGITGLLGGLTGATGSTLAGLTGATIGAGTQVVAGGTTEDILKAALLGGGGSFLGSELQNALYDSTAAADIAGGLNPKYGTNYEEWMSNVLDNPEAQKALADYINGVTTSTTPPVAVSTPVTDGGVLNITGTTTPAINAGGLLGSTLTPTLTVTGAKTPQQVDQSVINLINSQLGTNVGTPSNLANVQVTGSRPVTTPEVVNAITAALPTIPSTTAAGTTPEVKVTAQKPTTVGDTLAALPSTLLPPTVTSPTTTTKTTNELGLTDEQMANLLKAAVGLFGGLGAASLAGTPTTPAVGALPTQLPPMYMDDYFTKVQQNYNRLLPAVPRDVASPLRDWYTSQYGA